MESPTDPFSRSRVLGLGLVLVLREGYVTDRVAQSYNAFRVRGERGDFPCWPVKWERELWKGSRKSSPAICPLSVDWMRDLCPALPWPAMPCPASALSCKPRHASRCDRRAKALEFVDLRFGVARFLGLEKIKKRSPLWRASAHTRGVGGGLPLEPLKTSARRAPKAL